MARYRRLSVYNAMLETGLVPLFYNANVATAEAIIHACLQGGAICIEFTNRGDNAHRVFESLVDRLRDEPKLILGAGSIVDAATAALYIQLGANFIVSPIFDEETARFCNARKVAYLPGCATPTEVSVAERAGVEICKIFPSEIAGGPDFIKAVLKTMPWSLLMPTGGVQANPDSLNDWFKGGAACVGMSSQLIKPDCVREGRFNDIRQNVSQVLGWIRDARRTK